MARDSAAQDANLTRRLPGQHGRRVCAASPRDAWQWLSGFRTDMPEEDRICMRRLPKGAPVGGRVCQRGVRCKRCKSGAVSGVWHSAEVRGRVRARDIQQTLQQRKQASRRVRTAEGWRGQTVQQEAGMGSWHLRTRRCKKTRARSAQPCRGEKVQDVQLADKRTGQRNSDLRPHGDLTQQTRGRAKFDKNTRFSSPRE